MSKPEEVLSAAEQSDPASPAAILRGDYGPEKQRAFLAGAMWAIDETMTARLEAAQPTE